MNILVVSQNKNRRIVQRIQEEAIHSNLNVSINNYSDIEFSVNQKLEMTLHKNSALQPFQAVILDAPGPFTLLRDIMVRYFYNQKVFLLNGSSLLQWSSLNKILQIVELNNAKIPTIPTRIFGNSFNLKNAVKGSIKPLVAKSVDGSGGLNTYLIPSLEDLEQEAMRFHAPQHLLVQPKIEADKEYRVLIIGNNILGSVSKKVAPGDFRANWARNASFVSSEIPGKVKSIVLQSCQVLNLDFAGIDVFFKNSEGGEKAWIVEVNRFPGFEGFEGETKINVAHHILNFISERVS